MHLQDRDFHGAASGKRAVEELGTIAREKEKTKRLLIGAACLFVIVASLVITFSPVEKEKQGYAIGAALIVMALGAIGATQFRVKGPGGIEVDTRTQPLGSLQQPESNESVSRDDELESKHVPMQ